jgi:hypothetical protein
LELFRCDEIHERCEVLLEKDIAKHAPPNSNNRKSELFIELIDQKMGRVTESDTVAPTALKFFTSDNYGLNYSNGIFVSDAKSPTLVLLL